MSNRILTITALFVGLLYSFGNSQMAENPQPKWYSLGAYLGSLKMESLPFSLPGHQLLEGTRVSGAGFDFNARVWKSIIGLNVGVYEPHKEPKVTISELPEETIERVSLTMFYNTEILFGYPIIDRPDFQVLPSIGYGGSFGNMTVHTKNINTGLERSYDGTYHDNYSFPLITVEAYKTIGWEYLGLIGKKIFDDNHSTVLSANLGAHFWSKRAYQDNFLYVIVEHQWGRWDRYTSIGLGYKAWPYKKPEYRR